MRVKRVYIAAVIVTFVAGAALMLWPARGEAPGTERVVFYEPTNVQVETPSGWTRDDGILPPQGLEAVFFALRSEDNACAIAYGPMLPSAFDSLKQISFGERVFAGDIQFDSDWYAPIATAEGKEFSDSTRQYLPGEMRITGEINDRAGDVPHRFVLYMRDGSAVPDECDSSLSGLLSSFTYRFEPVEIDQTSTGVLFVRMAYDEPVRLLYRADGSRAIKEVYKLGAAIGDPMIHNNEIYFADGSQLMAYDPLANRTRLVVEAAEYGRHVLSYAFSGDSVFYLASDSYCEGMGDCGATLVEKAPSGEPILGENVSASRIAGFDESEGALYLWKGYGDAGCISAVTYRYAIDDGVIRETGRYGYCEGDSGVESERAALESFWRRFGVSDSPRTIRLEKGGNLLPSEEASPPGASYPIRFAQ